MLLLFYQARTKAVPFDEEVCLVYENCIQFVEHMQLLLKSDHACCHNVLSTHEDDACSNIGFVFALNPINAIAIGS